VDGWGVGILLGLGAVLKHAVPAGRLNRWIPLINWVVGSGLAFCAGADPLTAVGIGGQNAAIATGVHQGVKLYTGKKI
jgi:hypothetical protein